MPNYLPGTAPGETAPPSQPLPSAPPPSVVPRLLAASLSAILPGVGHFLIDRRRNGLLFLLAFPLLFLLFRPLGLPRTVGGLGLVFIALLGLTVISMFDAGYSGRRETRLAAFWLALLLPLALVAGTMHGRWMMRVSGLRPYSVIGGSMAPAIPEGSRIMVDAFYYRHQSPKRGDIIACFSPNSPKVTVIKRVIAVGGETIEIRDGKVLINGTPIDEPYVPRQEPVAGEFDRLPPTTLPAGKVFVMGDDRQRSFDSRAQTFGLVDLGAVRGKVVGGPIKTFN